MAVCAGTVILLIMLTVALMNALADIPAEEMTVSMGDASAGVTASAEQTSDLSGTTNPADFCTSFIRGMSAIFVVIFTAIFVFGFYKDGYSKNVVACVKHRWYFQAAKAVCVAVYCAILLAVASVVSLVTSALLVDGFEFSYMGVFLLFLLGEFLLLNAIGLMSAFFTELTCGKVTAIVYILLWNSSK